MSVSAQPIQIVYMTDSVSTAFAVPFYFCQTPDLLVQFTDAAGVVHNGVLGTDYNITGTIDPKLGTYSGGGTVNYVTAPASGGSLMITRQTPIIQPNPFNPEDPFLAGAFEVVLDRLILIVQELAAGVMRA